MATGAAPPLHLVTNFRSVPGVVGAVNRLFAGPSAAWRPSAHQPPYVPIEAVRDDGGAAPVEVWTIDDTAAAGADERRLAEGRAVSRGIAEHVDAGGRYADVLVLLRAFTSVGRYLGPLRDAEIPFVVDGGRTFFERPEVAHVMAILRALASPTDPVAVLAYLRSPAGGVSDAELYAHAASGGSFEIGARVEPRAAPVLAARRRMASGAWSSTRTCALAARPVWRHAPWRTTFPS